MRLTTSPHAPHDLHPSPTNHLIPLDPPAPASGSHQIHLLRPSSSTRGRDRRTTPSMAGSDHHRPPARTHLSDPAVTSPSRPLPTITGMLHDLSSPTPLRLPHPQPLSTTRRCAHLRPGLRPTLDQPLSERPPMLHADGSAPTSRYHQSPLL
uniref:Predicted protein n=1 Tax=Hordeum vulgare subsp. vulgare TaxID=112509 RepID=F2DG69_HORVV|nr:predicted protein [Hordeum vulgare subsp. vulgare]